jgi:cyclomaltodextrinase
MQEVANLRSLFIPGKNLLKRSFWAFTVLSLGTVAMSSGQGKAASGKGILILGTDSDVWAWERTIEGKYYCPGEVQSITVEVNGNSVTAKWQAGEFEATIPLDDGINEVVAVCQLSDGTEYRSNTLTLTQKLVDKPRAQVDIQVTDRGILLTGANSQVGHGGSPITQYVWEISPRENPGSLYLVGSKEPLEQAEGSTLKLESPTIDGEYYITMTAIDQQGRKDSSRTYFVARDGKPQVANFDKEQPNWVKSLVIYGVMPHYFGLEGLKSVIERLDYLQELGVNALWISPIYDTFYGGHGYDVRDYFSVRSDFGTIDDLKELVKEAHARGIKVLLDFVPNHTSSAHRYMQDALEHGESSSYYGFYDRDDNGNPTHYFDWQNLPNLNYDNPEVWNWIMEAFSYWIRECDIDGFRVDACWGVQYRRPDFWPKWRREMKRIKADLLLIAEASARDEYNYTHGFDAAYDWTSELGHWSMEKVFEEKGKIGERLHKALTNNGKGYHEDAILVRFLENNDTGPRFITRYGLEMTRVAATMLLTLPGIPIVYTGQEDGEEFEPYKYAWPLLWWDEHGLRQHYQELIRLRRGERALHGELWEPAESSADGDFYGYWRYDEKKDAIALVLLNFSDEYRELKATLPQGASEELLGALWQDARPGKSGQCRVCQESRSLGVTLEPWDQLILIPKR